MTNGIIIAGYGTRKGNLEEILQTQARRLRCRGWENVEIGYFRVSSPTIPEALERLVDAGVDNVVIIPYYIAEGTLTKQLIPEKLKMDSDMADIKVKGKDVTICMAPAFGMNMVLTDILCDKIADAGGDTDCGIMIIGHGTRYDSLANMRVIKQNAERLKSMGYIHTKYTFNEFCEPTIKDTLDELEKEGVERIIALPLFIAMGLHLGDEIPEQIGIPSYSEGGDITINGRKINVYYGRPVEADNRLTDYLDMRAAEYLSG
ncbi:MAG: cobalamin biosynthesis protein CbiX [Candidatus Methanomethylophilaceae archaeon]|nr:cobalamin biosynthesis protein CbiX [Candidatus Methanomethylophilaceae archaeon]MBR6214612.1 cobalamin biosynthesis protein CbiX [Candidatus Methanomethylophilaceae archaeon]